MKKIIITMFAGLVAFFGSTLLAQAQSFNADPRDMATVLVAKGSCTSGAVNGCWQPSVTANPGDIVAVHVYYHNTGTTVAQNVAIGFNPRTTGVGTSHVMRGGILVNGHVVKTGSAIVGLSSPASLTFIDAQWFPNQSTTGQSVDGTALFDNYGMSVGSLAPGWGSQGSVVARYKVGNNIIVPPIDTQCFINSFYANPTTVNSGGYTTLYWSTSGCDYVTVDGVQYPVNGTGSFGPIYSGRNYELRASKNSTIQTRTVYVGVQQVQPPTVYACNDGYDNDSDGFIDYPNDPGCSSYIDNDEYNMVVVQTRPQAITTVATISSTTSARLNGIAVPNVTGVSSVWFEWGTSGSLGNRTNTQNVTGAGSQYYSSMVTGLVPGTIYYYRAAVQNQNGTAYGDVVRFQTQTATPVTPTPPTRVITRTVVQQSRDTVVARSQASLLELRVENVYDRMCVGGDMEYTITYRNISGQTLQNAVLRVAHPQELTFINGTRGTYEAVDRALTIPLGDLTAGESGQVIVRARVNNQAIRGNVAVLTAQVVYTNTISRAQEDAIAYSLINISDTCPNNNLGASAFGIGSFFPNTLLGWLILILVILALIVLGRQFYKRTAAQG